MHESELENQLRAFQPAAPSNALKQRIAKELARSQAAGRAQPSPDAAPGASVFWSRLFPGFGWALGGAAAAVMVLTFLHPRPPERPSTRLLLASPPATADASGEFERAESETDLVTAQETDLLYMPNNEPARMVRYRSVERHVWQNPTTGARVEVEAPREDVMLLPVSFQ